MPTSNASTKPNTKQSMYRFMLSHELDEAKQTFLSRAIFEDQDALLSSIDLSKQPSLVTKTDVDMNDKAFLTKFSDILRESQFLKLEQTVIDNMLQSLYKQQAASKKERLAAQYKIAFVEALLSERKFFINVVRSLLRIVQQVSTTETTSRRVEAPSGAQIPFKVPIFQDDPFLQQEFQKMHQNRSASPLHAATSQKRHQISRLMQPGGAQKTPTAESEYQGEVQTRTTSDRALGLVKSARKHYTKEAFSFADSVRVPQEGVYQAQGNKMMTHRPDMAHSHSPSFGPVSAKSPHSQNAVVGPSRTKSVLREYNHLFKRIETVQLKHKWETDDEDGDADVMSSESSSTVTHAGAIQEASDKHAQTQADHHRQGNTHERSDSNLTRSKKSAVSVGPRRIQKPEQNTLLAGKRANVRTSVKQQAKKAARTNVRQNTSRSPIKQQSKQSQIASVQPQQLQQPAQLQQSSLFKQGQQQQTPQFTVIKNKVTSRNSKIVDLYTQSVPSLGNEKTKTAKEMSSVASTDVGDKKQKLLKDASLALAMTMSPTSQTKTGAVNKKTISNPQFKSTDKFERTYQSLSSQKKYKASGQQSSRSPESSICSKGSKERERAMKKQIDAKFENQSQKKLVQRRQNSSQTRYVNQDHKESLCEPNDLVQQLRQEQQLEYASHQSSSLHNMQKQGPPLMPTDKGAISATMDSENNSLNCQKKRPLIHKSATKSQLHQEQDEYELGKTGRRVTTTSSSKQRISRVIGGQASSKKSQSKLLATSTAGSNQLIIEGPPNQPKKLEKDAKLLFSPSNGQAAQKKAKLSEAVAGGKMMTRQSSMPAMSLTVSATRRNSDYNHLHQSDGSHQIYQVKSMRDIKDANSIQGAFVGQNASQKIVSGLYHHNQSMQQQQPTQLSAAKNKKLGSQKIPVSKAETVAAVANRPSGSSKQQQQRGRFGNQPAVASSSAAYGGIKMNQHQDQGQNMNRSGGQQQQQQQQQQSFPTGSSGKSSRQRSDNRSCYDEDADLEQDSETRRKQITRYNHEVMQEKVFSPPSQGFDTGSLNLHLETGPQAFEKEDDEDDESNNGRQQIFFIDKSSAANTNADRIGETSYQDSFAQNFDLEPIATDNYEVEAVAAQVSRDDGGARTQVYQLAKPSESVAQSYQHEEGEMDDEAMLGDDQDAMFEHLNQSDTNQDADQSRRHETYEDQLYARGEDAILDKNLTGGEMQSEKVSFNLECMSPIKHKIIDSKSKAKLSDGHKFSVHKASAASEGGPSESQLTCQTISNAKMKHNMSNIGASDRSQFSAKHAGNQSQMNQSSVKSVNVDLITSKRTDRSVVQKKSSIEEQSNTTRPVGHASSKNAPNSQRAAASGRHQQQQSDRNAQSQSKISQDFSSEHNIANLESTQQYYPHDTDIDGDREAAAAEEVEDAEREHKLSQVRLELYRGQEKSRMLSSRHKSSSSSERSCNDAQFKSLQKKHLIGRLEQSPTTKSRKPKDRRNLFFGDFNAVESSTEMDGEECEKQQQDQYGANSSEPIHEYSMGNVKVAKNDQKKTTKALASLSAHDPHNNNNSQQKRQSSSNFFGGAAVSDHESSGGANSQNNDDDDDINNFLTKRNQRKLQ